MARKRDGEDAAKSGDAADSGGFVSRLVSNPADPPETTLLAGYPGESAQEGHTRLYLDAELSGHVDIPNDDILHSEPSGEGPLARTLVWVRAGSTALSGGGEAAAAADQSGGFFQGPVFQNHFAETSTARGQGGPRPRGGQGILPTDLGCPSLSLPCRTARCTVGIQCHSLGIACTVIGCVSRDIPCITRDAACETRFVFQCPSRHFCPDPAGRQLDAAAGPGGGGAGAAWTVNPRCRTFGFTCTQIDCPSMSGQCPTLDCPQQAFAADAGWGTDTVFAGTDTVDTDTVDTDTVFRGRADTVARAAAARPTIVTVWGPCVSRFYGHCPPRITTYPTCPPPTGGTLAPQLCPSLGIACTVVDCPGGQRTINPQQCPSLGIACTVVNCRSVNTPCQTWICGPGGQQAFGADAGWGTDTVFAGTDTVDTDTVHRGTDTVYRGADTVYRGTDTVYLGADTVARGQAAGLRPTVGPACPPSRFAPMCPPPTLPWAGCPPHATANPEQCPTLGFTCTQFCPTRAPGCQPTVNPEQCPTLGITCTQFCPTRDARCQQTVNPEQCPTLGITCTQFCPTRDARCQQTANPEQCPTLGITCTQFCPTRDARCQQTANPEQCPTLGITCTQFCQPGGEQAFGADAGWGTDTVFAGTDTVDTDTVYRGDAGGAITSFPACDPGLRTPFCLPRTRLCPVTPFCPPSPFCPPRTLRCQQTPFCPQTLVCAPTRICAPSPACPPDWGQRQGTPQWAAGDWGQPPADAFAGGGEGGDQPWTAFCPEAGTGAEGFAAGGEAPPFTVNPQQCRSAVDACPTRFGCPEPTVDARQCPSAVDACPTRFECPPPTADPRRCPSVVDACPTRACTRIPNQCQSAVDACPTRFGCPQPTADPRQCPSAVDACPTRACTRTPECVTVATCPTQLCTRNPRQCASAVDACPTRFCPPGGFGR